jgi:hypothetical protein
VLAAAVFVSAGCAWQKAQQLRAKNHGRNFEISFILRVGNLVTNCP